MEISETFEVQSEYVNIRNILNAFSAPLNEEQAWGVCHQCALFLRESLRTGGRPWLATVHLQTVGDVRVHSDGAVSAVVQESQQDSEAKTESQLVHSLGAIIYEALDYGLSEDEERILSPPLENLITFMTSEEEESSDQVNTDDEGIVAGQESEEEEDAHGSKVTGYRRKHKENTLSHVIKTCGISGLQTCGLMSNSPRVCTKRLREPSEAGSHYQAVCRALYTEVQELSTFLDKITRSKEALSKLSRDESDSGCADTAVDDLQPQEWAHIWMQVLRELRHGMKLKKVRHPRPLSIEYELTPYEILMDDIRSRRYSLNKVTERDKIPPSVKKEAHDIILDFIRSRPPLRKVRQPPFIQKEVPEEEKEKFRGESYHERIMKEIRSRPKLRPVAERKLPKRKSRKKKRPSDTADIDYSSSSESEYDYSYLDSPSSRKKKLNVEFKFSWSASETDNETEEEPSFHIPDSLAINAEIQKQLKDLSSYLEGAPSISPTSSVSSFDEIQSVDFDPMSPRRHTISLCQLEPWWKPLKKDGETSSEDQKYLSLSVEEVTHIRSVLVKAELENMRINPKLLEAVINEKVCFSCKKRFSFFGKKSRCKICSRLNCSICSTKLRIPKESFLQFPVDALSPLSSPKRVPTRRARSSSEPPTPSLTPESSPVLKPKPDNKNTEAPLAEDVCCQCKEFLKQALQSEKRGGLPTSPSFDEDLERKLGGIPIEAKS